MIKRLFKLREDNATVQAEAMAGIMTFMTIASIICVQPAVLSTFTIAVMSFCRFSITEGMVFGFVSYAPLNIIAGNTKKIHFLLCILSTLFIFRYAYLNT